LESTWVGRSQENTVRMVSPLGFGLKVSATTCAVLPTSSSRFFAPLESSEVLLPTSSSTGRSRDDFLMVVPSDKAFSPSGVRFAGSMGGPCHAFQAMLRAHPLGDQAERWRVIGRCVPRGRGMSGRASCVAWRKLAAALGWPGSHRVCPVIARGCAMPVRGRPPQGTTSRAAAAKARTRLCTFRGSGSRVGEVPRRSPTSRCILRIVQAGRG